jgi:hypothetical protein
MMRLPTVAQNKSEGDGLRIGDNANVLRNWAKQRLEAIVFTQFLQQCREQSR